MVFFLSTSMAGAGRSRVCFSVNLSCADVFEVQ